MFSPPSLVCLCVNAISDELIRGDELLPVMKNLPRNLIDDLALRLPPLPLQKLQNAIPFDDRDDHEFDNEGLRNGRKRGRSWPFNRTWKILLKLRWPQFGNLNEPHDWQQMYWEAHLQSCLDEVAEIASLPSFDGSLGETRMPDLSLIWIGCRGNKDYSKLYQQCQQFGYYARCLRLHNVLCGAETSYLLRNSQLQSLELRWIRSKEHIDGLCKLLNQNSESLTSVELIHCKLSSYCINAICYSLLTKSVQTHGIKHFSINTSNFLETNPASLPLGLVSFLSLGRSLHSLKLSDNHLGSNFAKMVFDTLLNASSSLSILDLSDNNISGWLSELHRRSPSRPPTPLGIGKSLLSLRVLNLRDNNLDKDDADCLRYALVHMPSLEVLDMSDNPIEDDGLRSLIPYFVEVSERCTPFSDLKLESCDLSCDGMTQFIDALSTLDRPLKCLSIANNSLGSKVAASLGKLLSTAIQVLNIEGIGLGASGFQELQGGITKELKLVKINISKNRGGNETAEFLFTLISSAPELATVNAAYNCMPVKSFTIICSAAKASKGNLESIDLRGNNWDDQPGYASMIADIQCNGRPAFILSSSPTKDAPYDDEP